jgi:hypothetical protein
VPDTRRGAPRRHFAGERHLFHGDSPGAGNFVAGERKREPAFNVAGYTSTFDQRPDFAGPRYFGRDSVVSSTANPKSHGPSSKGQIPNSKQPQSRSSDALWGLGFDH